MIDEGVYGPNQDKSGKKGRPKNGCEDLRAEKVCENKARGDTTERTGNVRDGESDNKVGQGELYGVRVIIAEDNRINQKLLTAMLNSMGIATDIVSNGSEAMQKFKNSRYDLIFIDLSMPELDCAQITQQISEIERRNDLPHTPVVALTADIRDSIKGGGESQPPSGRDCWDYYLSKPIDIDTIRSVIERHVREIDRVQNQGNSIDLSGTAKRLGLQERFILELCCEFIEIAYGLAFKIEEAIAGGDFTSIRRAAHQLKGAAVNLRIARLTELSTDIEVNAQNEASIDYAERVQEIRREIELLQEYLRSRSKSG